MLRKARTLRQRTPQHPPTSRRHRHKHASASTIFQIWWAFADEDERAEMRQSFADGISWGDAKKKLYERVNDELAPARATHVRLLENLGEVEVVLQKGAAKLRPQARALIERVREAVGLRPFARL